MDAGFAINFSTKATDRYTFAANICAEARGLGSTAVGFWTLASGPHSFAEGESIRDDANDTVIYTEARGQASHAEGFTTLAEGDYSHSEGHGTIAGGYISHAEGKSSKALGNRSHAEGYNTEARAENSHAEGSNSIATGDSAHAEGHYTEANGYASHAEGYRTKANGLYSHASGRETEANGRSSVALGQEVLVNGDNSFSTGYINTVNGEQSAAIGNQLLSNYDRQCVIGRLNDNKATTIFEAGNGSSSVPNNSFEIYYDGKIVAPDLTNEMILDNTDGRRDRTLITFDYLNKTLATDFDFDAIYNQTEFILTGVKASKLRLYRDGIKIRQNEYSIAIVGNDTKVTLVTGSYENEWISIEVTELRN
jgi:autotransporter adhesin